MTIVINKHVMGGYQVLFPLFVAVYASLHLTLMVPPGGGVVIPFPEGKLRLTVAQEAKVTQI